MCVYLPLWCVCTCMSSSSHLHKVSLCDVCTCLCGVCTCVFFFTSHLWKWAIVVCVLVCLFHPVCTKWTIVVCVFVCLLHAPPVKVSHCSVCTCLCGVCTCQSSSSSRLHKVSHCGVCTCLSFSSCLPKVSHCGVWTCLFHPVCTKWASVMCVHVCLLLRPICTAARKWLCWPSGEIDMPLWYVIPYSTIPKYSVSLARAGCNYGHFGFRGDSTSLCYVQLTVFLPTCILAEWYVSLDLEIGIQFDHSPRPQFNTCNTTSCVQCQSLSISVNLYSAVKVHVHSHLLITFGK